MKDRWSIAAVGDNSLHYIVQIKNDKPNEDTHHDNTNQDYFDNYNPNNAETTAEPEYYTPSADFEQDCKDIPKMIPGASREFENVNPSTEQEQKSSPEIVKRDDKKIFSGKAGSQKIKYCERIVFSGCHSFSFPSKLFIYINLLAYN